MPRPSPSAPQQGLSTVMVAALAFGAAGFGFGSYFYLVPFQRRAAELQRVQKELRARGEARPRVDLQLEDTATRQRAQMQALARDVEKDFPDTATVIVGVSRLVVRFPEEKIFEARGPWLSKSGQETVQALGGLLAARGHRVVVSAPMGAGTVPKWVRGQLPTPADLSGARAGNALKSLVKGGVRVPEVMAVVGMLAPEGTPEGVPSLDFEIEP